MGIQLSIRKTILYGALLIAALSFIYPFVWMIGAAFEAMIAAAYFWRLMRAVKMRQNGIVFHAAPGSATETVPITLL